MAQISQPQVQLAAPSNTNAVPLAMPWLSSEEIDWLRKFNRCFNCKKKSHVSRHCTKLSRPYSAVSVLLQKVTMVKKDASELGKD